MNVGGVLFFKTSNLNNSSDLDFILIFTKVYFKTGQRLSVYYRVVVARSRLLSTKIA